jgi:hypothetical protein
LINHRNIEIFHQQSNNGTGGSVPSLPDEHPSTAPSMTTPSTPSMTIILNETQPLLVTHRQQQQQKQRQHQDEQSLCFRLLRSCCCPSSTNSCGPSIGRIVLIISFIVYVLSTTTGTLGYFFHRLIRIPQLDLAIRQLHHQVFELQNEVNQLSVLVQNITEQNNRYSELNNELNATVVELSIVNQNLQANNELYTSMNHQFNESNWILHTSIDTFTTAIG